MTTPDHTLAAWLADPNAIHINMLNGRIAKPSVAQIVHIYAGQLITTAEADARVEAAVLAERDAILAEVDDIRARYAPIGSKEWRLLGRVRAAIRSRGVTG